MQKIIALPMAEYSAAPETVTEIIFLQNLLGNVQLNQADYTLVFEDKTVCVERANLVLGGRERGKHGHMPLY